MHRGGASGWVLEPWAVLAVLVFWRGLLFQWLGGGSLKVHSSGGCGCGWKRKWRAGGDVGENRWVEAGRWCHRRGSSRWRGVKGSLFVRWVGMGPGLAPGAGRGGTPVELGPAAAAGRGGTPVLLGIGLAWGRVGSWVAANGQGKTGPLALGGLGGDTDDSTGGLAGVVGVPGLGVGPVHG